MTTAEHRQPPVMRVPGLGPALLVTLLVGAVGSLLAVVGWGTAQLAGVLVGTAAVAAFFLFGMLNTALAAAYAPRTAMLVALSTYTVQVVALGLLLVAVSRSGLAPDRLDVRWLAGTVIAGALGWTVALVVDALGTELPGSGSVPSEEVVRR